MVTQGRMHATTPLGNGYVRDGLLSDADFGHNTGCMNVFWSCVVDS